MLVISRFFEEFDIVFSNASLHWLSDHRPVLEGIQRCLVKGGRVVLQMGGKGNADKIFNVLGVMQDNSRWRKYFDDFTFTFGFFYTTEYRQLLVDAGLVPVRVELIPKDIAYPGREDFAG